MRKTANALPDFGELISTAESSMLDDSQLPHDMAGAGGMPDPANLLWEYMNLGTIDGYKVDTSERDLPIESQEMLVTAMRPVMSPASEILVITPDNKDDLNRYNELRQMEANKDIVILGETSQYDSARAGYVVWVKYAYVMYKLAPRFEFLKEK